MVQIMSKLPHLDHRAGPEHPAVRVCGGLPRIEHVHVRVAFAAVEDIVAEVGRGVEQRKLVG